MEWKVTEDDKTLDEILDRAEHEGPQRVSRRGTRFLVLVEHMRLVQLDSLNYMRDSDYRAPRWPDDFWPAEDAVANEDAWDASVEGFRADLAGFVAFVEDESCDLSSPIPSNPKHTLLRSIMVIAAHNHYHTGEFAALRQVMGTWGADHTD